MPNTVMPNTQDRFDTQHVPSAHDTTDATDAVTIPSSDFAIGVLGGMCSYATVDFFHRLVDAFPGRYEWDRPRILIDNRCAMPSRVRAILYGERREELVRQLAESTRNLIASGATKVIYACNTSHIFLDEVKAIVPEAGSYLIDMSDLLAQDIHAQGIQDVYLLATEGTLQVGIYQDRFAPYGIAVESADVDQQPIIREFIELVKQNKVDDEAARRFQAYLVELGRPRVILGCTELPVLYRQIKQTSLDIPSMPTVFDPMQSAIDTLVKEFIRTREGAHTHESTRTRERVRTR
jgi:aspartate racemase